MGTRTWEVTISNRSFKLKLAKARAEALAHRIKDATVHLPQHCRELCTYQDGTEHVLTTMVLFGKGQAPIQDPEAWQAESAAALDKWAATIITEANLTECLTEFKTIYEKHIPVLDKRQTAEELAAELAEERREREEREAERKATAAAAVASHLSQFGIDPETAPIELPEGKMAIVLRTTFDNSDSMSDYYDPHHSIGVPLVLAVVNRQSQTQALARMAIGRYQDLSGIAFEWKTETYRGGHGNYLQSPYLLDITDHYANGTTRRCRYEIQFQTYRQSDLYPYKGYPGNSVQSPQEEAQTPLCLADGITATIGRNTAKDGIEIRFSDRPGDDVINRLKAARWRWSRFSKCWYTRYSHQAEAFAAELVKSLQPEAEEISIPPAEVSADLAAEVEATKPAEEPETEETLTAEEMSAITGQEWTEEALEQFRAVC